MTFSPSRPPRTPPSGVGFHVEEPPRVLNPRGPGIDERQDGSAVSSAIQVLDEQDLRESVERELGFVPCRANWCEQDDSHPAHRRVPKPLTVKAGRSEAERVALEEAVRQAGASVGETRAIAEQFGVTVTWVRAVRRGAHGRK